MYAFYQGRAFGAWSPIMTDAVQPHVQRNTPQPVPLPGRCPTCNSLAGYHWTIDQHRYAVLLGRARLVSYITTAIAGGSLLAVAILLILLLAR